METTMTVLQDIQNQLKKKYNQVNNIFNMTRALEQAIQAGDEESFSLLLDMRQNVMTLVDETDAINDKNLAKLPPDLEQKLRRILHPDGSALQLDNPLESDILRRQEQIQLLLQRIVAADNAIQRRLDRSAR